MRRLLGKVAPTVFLVLVVFSPIVGAAEDGSVVQEVLQILRERGIVEDAEYERLALKNQAYEQKQTQDGFLSSIDWSGDARVRIENFWYDRDELGNDRSNRARFRYRLRLQGLVPINDSVQLGFRLASGEDNRRSTNTSAGKRDPDFDPDLIFLDRAWVELRAPVHWLGERTSIALVAGKQGNPFLWKHGKDYLLWDHDINPEGGALKVVARPSEQLSLFLNTGYFVLDENSRARDPHLFGIQGGFGFAASEEMEFGGRVTWYNFRSLDDAFFTRTPSSGSLPGGLTNESPGGDSDGISAGELAAYLRYRGIESWPILAFGHLARNFDARSTLGASDEDLGWGLGLEIGDKKQYVKLGVGYYELQANFFPSQFVDSDLTDGVTNRKGWTFYGSRQILPHTDFNLELFLSDEIESDVPPFGKSVSDAERLRLRTDIVVKF